MRVKVHRAMIAGMTLALAVVAGQARASLLAEETFDYAVGGLNGQAGGTGWAGAWSNPGNEWAVTTPGLAVPGLGISSPDNGITCVASGNIKTTNRDFTSAFTSGVVYLGAVLRKSFGPAHYGYVAVVNGINYGFKIGWNSDNWHLSGGGAAANAWGAPVDSGVPIVLDEPVLAVLKIDIDNKTGYLYINQAEEGTPDCIATGVRFGMLTLSIRGANNGASSVDDIRIGTTYADVAAVHIPNPTIITIR